MQKSSAVCQSILPGEYNFRHRVLVTVSNLTQSDEVERIIGFFNTNVLYEFDAIMKKGSTVTQTVSVVFSLRRLVICAGPKPEF